MSEKYTPILAILLLVALAGSGAFGFLWRGSQASLREAQREVDRMAEQNQELTERLGRIQAAVTGVTGRVGRSASEAGDIAGGVSGVSDDVGSVTDGIDRIIGDLGELADFLELVASIVEESP